MPRDLPPLTTRDKLSIVVCVLLATLCLINLIVEFGWIVALISAAGVLTFIIGGMIS